jgi:hypothetical protein
MVAAREAVLHHLPMGSRGYIDLQHDPDVPGRTRLVFTLSFSGSVEDALAADDDLQLYLIEHLPDEHRSEIAFVYRFE